VTKLLKVRETFVNFHISGYISTVNLGLLSMADASDTGSINSSSLIPKLCFIRFGGGLDRFGDRLKGGLTQFLNQEGDPSITRPAIAGWFRKEKRSMPTKVSALAFLQKYVETIEYGSLDADRKKVFTQIQSFLKNRIPTSSDFDQARKTRLRVVPSGHDIFSIKAMGMTAAAPRLAHLEGVYFAYHARLTEDYKGQFTQELVRITRSGRNLQFDLWYLKDGQRVERYHGVIFLFGTILWFVGSTEKPPDRLRVMIFRDLHSEGRKYTDLRCGLMMSDIPTPASPDPVACRIVLYRIRKQPENIYKFAKENVRTFSRGETLQGKESKILRLVDNALTAHSSPLSADPAVDGEGRPIVDNVLKIDQHTVDRVSDLLFDI
jgi:hypothetical protein